MNVLSLRHPSTKRRVLLLEDHDLLRKSMVRALSELPATSVVGVATLQEALREIDSRSPDLVVSDLDLPDGSGLELMPRLAGPKQPPVVFVSAHVSRFEAQLGNYPGVVVLDKPLPARTLKYIASEQLEVERAPAAPFAAGDYIQLACMGRHSVRIDVSGPAVHGSVYVARGRLWAALCGRLDGVAALRELVFAEGGRVTCSGAVDQPEEPNLPDAPWEQLLLDLAKSVDEGTREMSAVGTRETPVAGDISAESEEDDVDFSNIFDEVPDDAMSQPSPSSRDADQARFERLVDEAADALLSKDYAAALLAYENADLLCPGDSIVSGNVARLRELVEK